MDGMWLWLVGSAGVWGALECGLQLFTWQGLTHRCEAVGVSGDVRVCQPREKLVPLPPPQNEPILGPLHSWRGLTPTAGSLGSLDLRTPTPDGGPALPGCPQMLDPSFFFLPPHSPRC